MLKLEKRGILLIVLLLFLPLALAAQLKVTSEHPFLVDGKWISASELNVGDKLSTIDGKTARITGIKEIKDNVKVYNLESSLYHDFVLSSGVIVHNSNAPLVSIKKVDDNYVFSIDWGSTSEEITGKYGMTEKIIIDHADEALAGKVVCEYKKTIGQLPSNPTWKELEQKLFEFSIAMNQQLPFLGRHGYAEIGSWNELQGALTNYLKLIKNGKSLSELGKTMQLSCTGQALTIKDALGKGSGWELYVDLSPRGNQRVHTFLAKKFDSRYAIIDSTELGGVCNHGFVREEYNFPYPKANIVKINQ